MARFSPDPLVRPLDLLLRPEPARVVLRPFVPAENGGLPGTPGPSRVQRVLDRVLALDAETLATETKRVMSHLSSRHRDVERVLQRRFYDLVEPQAEGRTVTPGQALLAGAYFVEEYSFEAAALFNPSIVLHPDQSGLDAGVVRVVLSLRGVGEGHISSIIFRTGTFSQAGGLVLDPPSRLAASPQIEFIPGGAPDDPGVRMYFGEHEDLSELVIFPVTLRQRHGIEDLRLVRFTEDDGHVTYLGTYTAFSGEAIRQELFRTGDFVGFELSALRGEIARTKGTALFPRRVGGHYAMLARQDHENLWLLRSNDLYEWGAGEIVVTPRWPWEFIQLGNSSPPIEIDEGWLVIIHGVGPVRNYCLGACLLDKENPAKLVARTAEPLIRPSGESRDGYVPNVTYSCGAMALGRTLLLPYGVADSFTAFATVSIDALIAAMA